MEVKLRCSGTLFRVASLRLYILPDSPMRVEIDVEFDSESLKSVTWSELKDSWMGGTAKIEVGNAAIDKLSLQGAGWIPRKLDGEIRDVVQTFVGFSIDEELYSWLLKSTTQSTEPFLLYQRKLKEKAWDFLGRCLGNKLMESTPTGVHFDRSIAPAACIAREKDWNHVEFLTALCQHLSHVDRKLEGWSTLGDKIWLLASAANPTIDLSEGWKVGGDGWTDSLLEGSPTSDSEMVIGSDSGNLVEFLIALTGANQLKFTWNNHELPRLPSLVSVNSKNYFCRKICYTFSFKGGDTYNWTCRCKLRRANRPPSTTPLRHVKLAGQFHKWADDDKYCLIKPIARAWKVVDTFMTDLVPDNEGLLAQIYVPGHQSSETNRRDGLFFQCKSQDEIPFDLIPGDLPKAHGILQRKSDATDSLTFALIDGENRLSGTAQKTITITSEQDINLSAVKGKIKLEAKPLEIKASAVNISSPSLGNNSTSSINQIDFPSDTDSDDSDFQVDSGAQDKKRKGEDIYPKKSKEFKGDGHTSTTVQGNEKIIKTNELFNGLQRPKEYGEVTIEHQVIDHVQGMKIERPVKVSGLVCPTSTKGRSSAPESVSGLQIGVRKSEGPPRHRNTGIIDADKGHIMALELGGPDIPDNIVPQWSQWQRNGKWRKVESDIYNLAKKAEEKGNKLHFEANVEYKTYGKVEQGSLKGVAFPTKFKVVVTEKDKNGNDVPRSKIVMFNGKQERTEIDDKFFDNRLYPGGLIGESNDESEYASDQESDHMNDDD